jgi:hypothetical protein
MMVVGEPPTVVALWVVPVGPEVPGTVLVPAPMPGVPGGVPMVEPPVPGAVPPLLPSDRSRSACGLAPTIGPAPVNGRSPGLPVPGFPKVWPSTAEAKSPMTAAAQTRLIM